MNKRDLIRSVSVRAKLTNRQARAALEATLNSISEALRNGSDVQITGFGSFIVAHRTARRGVHPGTGQIIAIPAKRAIRFRPGKQLRTNLR